MKHFAKDVRIYLEAYYSFQADQREEGWKALEKAKTVETICIRRNWTHGEDHEDI